MLPSGKSFSFSVVATGCEPLDPRLVVDPWLPADRGLGPAPVTGRR